MKKNAALLTLALALLVGGLLAPAAFGSEETAASNDAAEVVEGAQPAAETPTVERTSSKPQAGALSAVAPSQCGSPVEKTFDPLIPLLNWGGGGLCGAPPACNMPCTNDQYCKNCCAEPDRLSICHQASGCCLC